MTHWDAIKASKSGLATRPYYNQRDMARPEVGKYIVMTARHDAYLIWADTLTVVRAFHRIGVDPDKCAGRSDWEPIENRKRS